MREKRDKSRNYARPPRIRVPNGERALFTVENQRFVGVIRCLSLTGGSMVSRQLISPGTLAQMSLNTVFGRVNAQIEFLRSGADGIPMAQAFRFLAMDDVSSERFAAAARRMEVAGFSDATEGDQPKHDLTSQSLHALRQGIRRLTGIVSSKPKPRARR